MPKRLSLNKFLVRISGSYYAWCAPLNFDNTPYCKCSVFYRTRKISGHVTSRQVYSEPKICKISGHVTSGHVYSEPKICRIVIIQTPGKKSAKKIWEKIRLPLCSIVILENVARLGGHVLPLCSIVILENPLPLRHRPRAPRPAQAVRGAPAAGPTPRRRRPLPLPLAAPLRAGRPRRTPAWVAHAFYVEITLKT